MVVGDKACRLEEGSVLFELPSPFRFFLLVLLLLLLLLLREGGGWVDGGGGGVFGSPSELASLLAVVEVDEAGIFLHRGHT